MTAPVSGRIGRSAVTEGAYVQAAQATLLATVQQLDPVYVDLTQSTAEVLKLRRDLESGKLQGAGRGQARRCGSSPTTAASTRHAGTLQFTDVTVDPGTGSIALRALFPNPKGELLPGHVRPRAARRGREPAGAPRARRWASRATRRACPSRSW